MKKILSMLIACSIAITSFSAPWDIKPIPRGNTARWDKPLGKAAFTDPYVDNYNVSEIGTFGSPNHAALIQADFNVSVPVPYYVVIQVAGVWSGLGSAYKQFTLLYGTNTWHKSITYPLVGTEQVYPELYDLLDYGPQ